MSGSRAGAGRRRAPHGIGRIGRTAGFPARGAEAEPPHDAPCGPAGELFANAVGHGSSGPADTITVTSSAPGTNCA
ncbi:hypothetical protein ACGFWD_27415 [Streptomyces sp. NPDC048448]|uniref:hypothetical protein n=1 Tax=Streptomyces sp. NPDC048448 TaxID=3365554 RepID=UPI003722A848